MPARSFNPAIAALREQIARMEGESGPAREVLPFGLPELDRRLPGGGLALGCLHEVAGGGNGAVDGAAASCFAAGIIVCVCHRSVASRSCSDLTVSRMSSDAGLMLLREIERREGLAGCPATCVEDPRAPGKVQHSLEEIR